MLDNAFVIFNALAGIALSLFICSLVSAAFDLISVKQ